MFNWKKKLLSSLDINKQEKALDKNKTVEWLCANKANKGGDVE